MQMIFILFIDTSLAVLLEEPSDIFPISPGLSGTGDVFGIGEFHVGTVSADFGENLVGQAAGF